MRAVVQRVRWAEVRVEDEVVGRIEGGLLVYLGAGEGDGAKDVATMIDKLAHLRIFEDDHRPMNRSVQDVGGEVLVVSQFTLYGDCRRGRRPSFNRALEPTAASALIDDVIEGLKGMGIRTAQGKFRARMEVESLNQGPVTILIDTTKSF